MEYASTGFYPRFRNTCVITVTSYTDKLMRGYLYSPQLERSIPFENLMQLFLLLEDLMNHTNLPQRTMELRMFPTEEDARACGSVPCPPATGTLWPASASPSSFVKTPAGRAT
mgnify:CR=1 FL=1